MKKIYQIPTATVVNIHIKNTILSASDPNESVGVDPNETPQNPSGFDARRSNNAWDEEDEEDF